MFTDCGGDRNLYIKCFVILCVIYMNVYAFVEEHAGCVAQTHLCILSGNSTLFGEYSNTGLLECLLNKTCYKNKVCSVVGSHHRYTIHIVAYFEKEMSKVSLH